MSHSNINHFKNTHEIIALLQNKRFPQKSLYDLFYFIKNYKTEIYTIHLFLIFSEK
jgi:hypothetical protein